MKTDPDNIIDISESSATDNRPVETPVITIEKDQEKTADTRPARPRSIRRYRLALIGCILVMAVLAAAAWRYRYELLSPDVPVSFSDKEMLARIDTPYTPSAPGTTHTSDSVLGVAMDFFSLDGLRASLEPEVPDTADSSLVLFMRSADYRPDNSVIGSIVIDGAIHKDLSRASRPAYLAISNEGKPLVGVSLSDRVMNKMADDGGSFFRQYLLLSAGELPEKFHLHGKVERAAIGRTPDDRLFYICTRHPETMYDFADALREYDFSDAIYITGGNSYSFHRDMDGTSHADSALRSKTEKYSRSAPPAPFLVFRNK